MTAEPSDADQERALDRFSGLIERMPGLLDDLLAAPAYHRDRRPAVPHVAGVYLFTESGVHRYVGRSRNCNRRLGEHTRPKSTSNSAPFAFNLAKRDAGERGVEVNGARNVVATSPDFVPYFDAAKRRVRAMEFRFVPISDPVLSTLFEVYVAVALQTEGDFNLFETH